MPHEEILSPLEMRILEELQANALVEDAELATILDVPESVIRARIEWLEDNVIVGYAANIDWEAAARADLDEIDLQILKELSQPSLDLLATRLSASPRRRN